MAKAKATTKKQALKEKGNKGVEVQQCGETGKGVFAARRFRAGELVGRVLGRTYDDPNYGSEYCIDMGEDRSLEPNAPFRYLNHCCVPNCQLYTIEHPTGRKDWQKIVVETLATIMPGEQLTIDYGWAADAAIPCLCGHKKCRGWIVSVEDLPKVLAAQQ